MKAVFKHEVSLYYHSLLAYVFGAFLLEFIGIGAMLYNINRAVANFEYALGTFCIAFVGLVPVLTMRVMAEEKKQKTDQLLYSQPLTMTQVVLGKFAAMLVVFAAPMAVICALPVKYPAYTTPTAMPSGILCRVTASTSMAVRRRETCPGAQ